MFLSRITINELGNGGENKSEQIFLIDMAFP